MRNTEFVQVKRIADTTFGNYFRADVVEVPVGVCCTSGDVEPGRLWFDFPMRRWVILGALSSIPFWIAGKQRMNWKSIFLATAALVLLLQGSGKADLVVFGDSLSDVGNTADATFGAIPSSSDGYFQGRFTNGNVWVEHLAGYLGESVPTSSRNGGKNFAHGGAQVLDSGLLRPSLTEQVSGLGSAN